MSENVEGKSARRTLLLTTLHDVNEVPTFLASPLAEAARHSTESLEVLILSPAFNAPPTGKHEDGEPAGISRTASWDAVQRILTFAYVQATSVAQDLNRVLLNVEVFLKGTADRSPLPEDVILLADRIYTVTPPNTTFPPLPPALERRRAEFIVLEPGERGHHPPPLAPESTDDDPPHHHPPPLAPESTDDDPPHHHPPPCAPAPAEASAFPPVYPVVALGGTFDHLHAGHKILLSMGAWIARDKLIVGITDDALLTNKEYKEVLQPLAVRTARTRAFLERFKPGVAYDIVPIVDVYGPTGWDPNVQALVVSKETLSGAASIDKRRKELGLPPLQTFVIDVISATEASLDAEDAALLKNAKMSSTYIRGWVVENQGRAG